MPKDKPAPTSRSTAEHPNLEEEIRRRAYELYEELGQGEDRVLDDWLRAEAEVTARSRRSPDLFHASNRAEALTFPRASAVHPR
jgi:predicted nucleic acid-binding protein